MIKYRCFNKVKKVFFKWDLTMGFSGTTKIWEKVEAYTFVKDKKGNPIYEGDIVCMFREYKSYFPEDEPFEVMENIIGEVVSIPSKGVCIKNPSIECFLNSENDRKIKGYIPLVAYRTEIIGNIHENKKLLNEKVN